MCFITRANTPPPPSTSIYFMISDAVINRWGFCCFPGSNSVTSSPTAEASAIQIIEASLTNSSSEVESPCGAAAALPVTQQMTEMSISCEEEGASPKVEIPEPG